MPVRLLATIFVWVKIIDPTKLWKTVWKLTRSSDDGCALLSCMCREQIGNETRRTAEEIIAQTKDCSAASLMGFTEMRQAQGVDAAKKWVEVAGRHDCTNPEMMLYLKLIISEREGVASSETIEQILARNDLPGDFTRAALFLKAHKLSEQKRWKEAEKIADMILGIEENVDARMIKWSACLSRGDQKCAEVNLQEAKKQCPAHFFNVLVAQGYLFLGDIEKAMEWLYKARQEGFELQEGRSPIGVLAHSENFQKYCLEKDRQ